MSSRHNPLDVLFKYNHLYRICIKLVNLCPQCYVTIFGKTNVDFQLSVLGYFLLISKSKEESIFHSDGQIYYFNMAQINILSIQ